MLDTPADPHLDLITEMAAKQLRMPAALVNLVDSDRQWTKSGHGFPSGGSVDREFAFCSYTILEPNNNTIVPDTLLDDRFSKNPAVVSDPAIRFYAGSPLADKEGRAIGTLCVVDTKPRTFDNESSNLLSTFAKLVSTRLELYQLNAALRESEDHYRHATELSSQFSWSATPDGKTIEVSERWCALFGVTEKQSLGLGWADNLHPDDRAAALSAWQDSMCTGKIFESEYRLRMADGSYRWFLGHAAPRRDDLGDILLWYGTDEDIHKRKLAEIALQESKQRLSFALDIGRLGTWELDLNTKVITASDQCAVNFGLTYGAELAHEDSLVTAIHPDDRKLRGLASQRARERRETYQTEYRNIWPDGSIHWVRVTGRAVYDDDGRPIKMVGLSLDITDQRRAEEERQRAEEKLVYLAYHDPLTGLANRRLLNDRLVHALAAATSGSKAALLCIDLDRFKSVNDALGHEAGDRLLRQAAERLRGCVRDGDIVARYGGDEFAVLQTGVTSPSDVEGLALRMLKVLAKPFDLDGRAVVLGGSIGISQAPDDTTRPDQLLRNADTALYRAKTKSRGTHRFFEVDMDRRLQARHELKLGLGDGLARGEFKLFYQPLINLQTGRVTSFEALLRWQHPQRGLLPPGEFIQIAEETGWIIPAGRWALKEACREAVGWPNDISVAVNLSVVQFSSIGSLEADVLDALRASGLGANRLQLEVTESLLLQDDETNMAVLQALRRIGISIAMDDFGTGYSSLSYLRKFSFDKIKIDRSLVSDLPDGDGGDAIVRAIIGLGRSLGISTTAEGVETAAQLELVRAQGCVEAQGYFFSPPVPGKDVPALLDRRWPGTSTLS